ncbi:MAG: C25 family cysteine peptidase [bacterium]
MRQVVGISALLVLVLATFCWAATVTRTADREMVIDLTFDPGQFEFTREGGYDWIGGSGVAYLPEPGLPSLPMRQVEIVIPYDMKAGRVRATVLGRTEVPGRFEIAPVQPPRILGQAAGEWVGGKAEVYLEDRLYPREVLGGVHQGFMGDSRLVSFYVAPFAWNPVTKTLELGDRIEVTVELVPAAGQRDLRCRPVRSTEFERAVGRGVVNPQDVAAYAAVSAESTLPAAGGFLPGALAGLEAGNYEYVVVTTQALAQYFEPLVEWKTRKGVPATLVTREWIEANYTGANVQEQMRNFIRDAYQTWGAVWILLGGDTVQIPSRQVYAMDYEMGPDGNRIRCDLYYSDLDGTWNANGLSPYGEVADSVDMYPDVAVGRAPVENSTEAQVFVSKVLTYEQNPPAAYALEMLMAGEVLWSNPFTDSGLGLDMIDDQCVPARFDPILKLYETLGNESRESVLAAMSAGQNIILHDGHCFYDVMGVGGSYLNRTDADTVSNGSRTFILNSIGCWPAAIDQDCIAERFINNPGGGCVAFVGNSRYGWGSPGNPGFGYSDRLQLEFARSLLVDRLEGLGLVNADSKAHFVPFAQDENVFRCNEYQVNLLGDPEMAAWTDEPEPLTVEAPDQVASPSGEVRVVVSDAGGAVADALVCLANGSDVYLVERTDLAGTAVFTVTTASGDSLDLTVTALDRLCSMRRIAVATSGKLLAMTDLDVMDGGDGEPNPGETFDLEVTVRNSGSETANGVWGVLRSRDGLAEVGDSTVYYGTVEAGSTSEGSERFQVTVGGALANGRTLGFELALSDTVGAQWASSFQAVVATPVLSVASYAMHDLRGDGDWIAEPGETVMVTLVIANTGLAPGAVSATATSCDPFLAASDSVTSAGTLGPGQVGHSLHQVVLSEACPAPYVGALAVHLASGALAFEDTVRFRVGDLAFSDDCESGQGGWTRAGSPDLWHLTTYRSHSGSASWYFGDDGTHTYPSSARSSITSQEVVAGEEATLSFWFWYEFTTYGTDGVYVVLFAGGAADTLDYLGSGGALPIGSRWVQWERTLEVSPGDTVAVRFEFKSDNSDVAEGMYIDDVSLTSTLPGQAGASGGSEPSLTAFAVRPNPASGDVTLWFGEAGERCVADIYDVAGRRVASVVKPAGATSAVWETGAGTARLAPGIYLAKIRSARYSVPRKIILLK